MLGGGGRIDKWPAPTVLDDTLSGGQSRASLRRSTRHAYVP